MNSEAPAPIHNPVSGLADRRAGLVIGEAQAGAMFRLRLLEMQPQLLAIVRLSCQLTESQVSDDALLTWMRQGMATATGCGMRSVEDVVGFITLMRTVGPRFHEFPAIRKYFARTDLPATGRILGLFAEVPVALWAVVQRHSAGPR